MMLKFAIKNLSKKFVFVLVVLVLKFLWIKKDDKSTKISRSFPLVLISILLPQFFDNNVYFC